MLAKMDLASPGVGIVRLALTLATPENPVRVKLPIWHSPLRSEHSQDTPTERVRTGHDTIEGLGLIFSSQARP
jgi:hypothetical protein